MTLNAWFAKHHIGSAAAGAASAQQVKRGAGGRVDRDRSGGRVCAGTRVVDGAMLRKVLAALVQTQLAA
jgi:hypothetical protein